MAAKILFNKPETQSLASIYKEYALQNAELVAKKELALIGLAINNAAAKGATSVNYKVSNDFRGLQGLYYNRAVEIMISDFEEGGYAYTAQEDRNQYVVSFAFDWSVVDNGESGNNDDSSSSNTPVDEDWEEIPDPVVEPEEQPSGV